MGSIQVTVQDESIRVTLDAVEKDGPDSFFGSHVLAAAISALIEGADVDGWEKHEDELEPMEFYAMILQSVATSYSAFQENDSMADMGTRDILRALLQHLEANDLL